MRREEEGGGEEERGEEGLVFKSMYVFLIFLFYNEL